MAAADTPIPVQIEVWRDQDPNGTERENRRFHRERAAFLHKLARDLNLEVVKWDKRIDDAEPHEVAEIVVLFVGMAAAGAVMQSFKGWLDRGEVMVPSFTRNVIVNGMSLRAFDVDEVLQPLRAQGLKSDDAQSN